MTAAKLRFLPVAGPFLGRSFHLQPQGDPLLNFSQGHTIKTRHLFKEVLTCFRREKKEEKTRVHYFSYFSRQTYVQPYNSKGLGESFPLMWMNLGLS